MTNWTRKMMLVLAVTGAVLGCTSEHLEAQSGNGAASARKPNVVFILDDNVGRRNSFLAHAIRVQDGP